MALRNIQWEFLGDFGALSGSLQKSGVGVILGNLGPQKGFAQISSLGIT